MVTSADNLPLFTESKFSSKTDPLFHETMARQAGYGLVAGVDEAGRGPLAGPVVAAAVIIPWGMTLEGIRDSKQMTEKAREAAFPTIVEKAVAVAVGVVSSRAIDECNILKASLDAMGRAMLSLDPMAEYFLIDGIHKVPVPFPQKCLIKGDRISHSISAASIVAKVYRDRIMRAYHRLFPVYGFWENKGYGTAKHLAAIRAHGYSPVHRLSFRGVRHLD